MYTDFVWSSVSITDLEKNTKDFRTQYVVLQSFANPAACKLWKQKNPSLLSCHVLIKPDAREVNSFKGVADLIAMKGGSLSLNHFGVSTKGIDLLIQSYLSGDTAIMDANMVMSAKQNNTAIVCFSSDLANAKNVSALLKYYRQVSLIARKKKVNFFLATGARNSFELRLPSNLSALSLLLNQPSSVTLKWVRSVTGFIERKQKRVVEVIQNGD